MYLIFLYRDGDLYASIRDCHSALQLDPSHRKAHFRLARGLLELTWIKEAQDCLEHFKDKFPEYTQYRECRALENDIRRAASTMKESGKFIISCYTYYYYYYLLYSPIYFLLLPRNFSAVFLAEIFGQIFSKVVDISGWLNSETDTGISQPCIIERSTKSS